MDRHVHNAFRVLALAADASLDDARARAAELGTPEAKAALARLEDPKELSRERLFAPGADARGQLVTRLAALVDSGGDAGTWRSLLAEWRRVATDPAVRELVADASLLDRIDLEVVTPEAEAVLVAAKELLDGLQGLTLDAKMTAPQKRKATELAGQAAPRVEALAARAKAVRALHRCELTDTANDGAAIAFERLAVIASWAEDGIEGTERWLGRALEVAVSEPLRKKLEGARSQVRLSEELKDVFEARNAGKVEKARRMLLKRRQTARFELRAKIDEMLEDPRKLLGPIRSAPTLSTVNGVGAGLYGNRDRGADGTYVATHCFCVLFIPIYPFRAYLVKGESRGYRFFGTVPLSNFARLWKRFFLLAVVGVPLFFFTAAAIANSSWVRNGAHIAAAERAITAKAWGRAADEAVAVLARGPSASRYEGAATVAQAILVGALGGVDSDAKAEEFVEGPGRRFEPLHADAIFAAAVLDAIEKAATRSGSPRIIEWGRHASTVFAKERSLPLAVALCEKTDDAHLLASCVRWHKESGQEAPAALVARLGAQLLAARSATWNDDALRYLEVAPKEQREPVLWARCERAWEGFEPGDALLPWTEGTSFAQLLATDKLRDREARIRAVTALAEPGFLPEPRAKWHRIGVARRLAKLYEALNEEDSLHHEAAPARKWAIEAAELLPGDPETAAPAMRFLLEEGEAARAVKLGEGLGGKRTPETVTYLGIALSRTGRLEEAAKVLRPYVDDGLPAYTRAYANWESATKAREGELWSSLRNGTADQALIRRLNSLRKEAAQREVADWINKTLKNDTRLNELMKDFQSRAHVHAGAFELAVVEIQLGRALSKGRERDALFQHAEKIFLGLRQVGGENPSEQLQLGQVYFWLGKREEAEAIYAKLEEKGDPKLLIEMGEIYRLLDQNDAARRVLEAAYDKAKGDMKEGAAQFRALTPRDEDDELAWLDKAGHSEFIDAIRAQTKGRRLLSEGDYANAVPLLRQAARFHGRDAENATGLHNASTAYHELYVATGDVKDLKEALRLAKAACDRAKDNGIGLRHYLNLLEAMGHLALAPDAVRPELLHAFPDPSWADFVRPEVPADAVTAKVRDQGELRRGLEVARRVNVVAPDSGEGYRFEASFFAQAGDGDSLRRLREELESANLNRAEAVERSRKFQKGEADPVAKKAYDQRLAAMERGLEAARRAQHAPTLALALVQMTGMVLAAQWSAPDRLDLDRAVALAEEAAKTFDAPACWETVATAHGERAARTLAKQDRTFANVFERCRDLDAQASLWLQADKDQGFRKMLVANEDVKAAALAIKKALAHTSNRIGFGQCVWLALANDPAAEDARKAVVSRGVSLESRRIDLLLAPESSTQLAEVIMAARFFGEEAVEKATWKLAKERGLLRPFTGE